MKVDLRQIPVFQIRLQDRKDFAKREMTRLGLTVKSVEGIVTRPAGIIGCGLSHVKVLKNSIHHGPILVLEDDAAATSEFRHEIEVPDGVDWVFLGIRKTGIAQGGGKLPGGVIVSDFDDRFYRIRAMLGTHAVLYMHRHVVQDAATRIMDGILAGIEIDSTTARMMSDWVTVTPKEGPWFYQAAANGGNEEDSRVKFGCS